MLQSYTTDIKWNDGNSDSDAHIMYVSKLEHHLWDYVHLRVIFNPVLSGVFLLLFFRARIYVNEASVAIALKKCLCLFIAPSVRGIAGFQRVLILITSTVYWYHMSPGFFNV